jgi:transposase
LRQELQSLRDELARLSVALEEERRRGKRQAAPFSKGPPVKKPKPPGRKSGKRHGPHAYRSIPPRIDESFDVPLPSQCSHCVSTHVTETHVATQYQTEIPRTVIYRRFDVHVGCCRDCGRAVQGRHELQTSSARGAAASQLGPNVHALLALINKALGLSHGKCVKLLASLFPELSIARSTSVRSILRTAERCEPAHQQLRTDLRAASEVAPDETGWRVGGRNAWLHVFVSSRTTCYVIDPTRSHKPAEDLLGAEWSGTMVHDGWSVYDRFTAACHQQCLAHLQRRCRDMLATAVRGATRFPRAVLTLVNHAFALRRAWRGHRLSRVELADHAWKLSCELQTRAAGHFTHEPNRRLAKHLLKRPLDWFWFLLNPRIQAVNHWAERAIRPAVVNRKVWGGNRTWTGAHAQTILTSVIQTCTQRAIQPFAFLLKCLQQPTPTIITA